MSKEPRAFARRGAQALTAATIAVSGGTIFAGQAQAVLPVPTITKAFVAGSTSNKVVTAGTTIEITGSGFTGMVDNQADSACNVAPVAYPGTNSGCSQVRFLGASASNTAGFVLATRYTVVSDTKIVVSVPSIAVGTGSAAGDPALGTGSVKVQVVNTTGTGTSSGISVSTASELFYREKLVANYNGTVVANPNGGGTLTVPVTGLPSGTTSSSFTKENITGYVYSTVAGSPNVSLTSVSFNDASNVNVTLPPGAPAGNLVGIMLVHDGITGTADANSLTYPAVISKIQACTGTAATAAATWVAATPGQQSATLPDCTDSANIPSTAGTYYIKVTGKGLTGATAWSADGAGGAVAETCVTASDTVAYCKLVVTTAPTSGVAPLTFTPADPDSTGDATAPILVPTGGSILVYNTLI
ncbi:hypothetical protein ACFQS1_35250 [Paractinoplanes rhizophilus]|uniref:IPT/TIG domain-containing protein n=1 Tax=Paractinoplanes rhizophilus TaxID=1416877 RepID=A0ABW2I351_9ACTN